MRIIISIALFIGVAIQAVAVPAFRQKHNILLADGTTLEATLMGDEFQHYYLADDGRTFQMHDDGRYHAVTLGQLNSQVSERRQQCALRRQSRLQTPVLGSGATRAPYYAIPGGGSRNLKGERRCLVVLADFSDQPMLYMQKEYNRFFNEKGYTDNGMNGSVRDYFLSCSYGQLDITFDVVGPVRLSKSVTYYGSNDSHGDDRHAGQMVAEAIEGAAASVSDFSPYDWDGDGEVDQVLVIYAGYGEAQSGIETNIWPHENTLAFTGDYGDGPGVLTYNGIKVNTYAATCELQGKRGDELDGIGTACHEFSHCMGLPDTYDTLTGANFGMDVWDVMHYGCYNGINGKSSTSPWEFNSYERAVCGWLTPVELKSGCEVQNMPALNVAPAAYIIYNDGNRNEFYMLENRQKTGFDAGGYGHGLIVMHVDYDKQAWGNNMVNTTASRQRVTIIPADNDLKSLQYGASWVAGDPYPGTSKKHELSDTSVPAAKVYNANTDGTSFMHKPLTNITEDLNSQLISFTFMEGGAVIDGMNSCSLSPSSSSTIYDFSGRRVSAANHGVYIVNGKKVILQ